ncbi:MAG: V-type ATPase subunit [Aerococcus sp.]|nr:V-type ATPase subunit [Aerococcus sp.]
MNEFTALNTKVRGMTRHLLKEEDWENANSSHSLNDIYQFLLNNSGYHDVINSLKSDHITTQTLTQALHTAVFYDFHKLFLFASLEQREILKLYGLRFEYNFIRRSLKTTEAKEVLPILYPPFADYLDDHRGFSTAETVSAESIRKVIATFSHTAFAPYFEQFDHLFGEEHYEHYAFEETFEQYTWSLAFKKARQILSKRELATFHELVGSEIDFSNISIIYRLKFYYEADENYISEQLLSGGRRLKKEDLDTLIQTSDRQRFQNQLAIFGYPSLVDDMSYRLASERQQQETLSQMEAKLVRLMPNSLLTALHYLNKKNEESERLIHIVEQVGFSSLAQIGKEYSR